MDKLYEGHCDFISLAEIVPKAENLLKIKGQKGDFSPPKADNILKKKPLTSNVKKAENEV